MRRRTWLLGATAGLAALGGRGTWPLLAQDRPTGRRLVFCLFDGGWDVLLGPDARDPARSYAGIDLGTDLLAARYRDPVPVSIGGRETLWGAPMASLTPHADVLTLFRGVNMNTVAHNTALPYVNTFRSPAGTVARGSSLGSKMASGGALGTDGPILPFVSLGMPVYNADQPLEASGILFDRASDIVSMLATPASSLPPALSALVPGVRANARSCALATYSGADPVAEQRLSLSRLERIERDGLASELDFDADTDSMRAIRTRFGFGSSRLETPGLQAAAASQLLRTGLCRAVAVRLSRKHDTHTTTWADDQPTLLEAGFDALAALVDVLREDDPGLESTTVVASSEFARTPRLNGQRGRDHWFANSFLVFGGLRPGIFGATGEEDLGLLRVSPETGLPSAGGLQLLPEHIAATIAAVSGLGVAEYRVDPIASLIPTVAGV